MIEFILCIEYLTEYIEYFGKFENRVQAYWGLWRKVEKDYSRAFVEGAKYEGRWKLLEVR